MSGSTLDDFKSRGQVYRDLGVRTLINAQGTTTTLGGSMVDPVAAEAMAAASHSMVFLKELNDRAGEMIARYTGAEAGVVTSGAAGGMLLEAAAVLAGTAPSRIKALPDTAGMKNEILILDQQKQVGYMHAWKAAGASLKPVNIDSAEMAGEAASKVITAAGPKTAAIGYIVSRWLRPDPPGFLKELCRQAHAKGLPVIVDAAAMLPPVENLKRYISEGADLVVFSGGKAIRAPQSTGILAGRRDLIKAAEMNGAPNDAVGRGMKICKEKIVGIMIALKRYVERDHAADQRRWRAQMQVVATALEGIPGVRAQVLQDDFFRPVPEVAITFGKNYSGPAWREVYDRLAAGDPPTMIVERTAAVMTSLSTRTTLQRARRPSSPNGSGLNWHELEVPAGRLRTTRQGEVPEQPPITGGRL